MLDYSDASSYEEQQRLARFHYYDILHLNEDIAHTFGLNVEIEVYRRSFRRVKTFSRVIVTLSD